MSRFDQDTSVMRVRLATKLIHLREPVLGPQTKARGIGMGVLLGLIAWIAIVAIATLAWRWLH